MQQKEKILYSLNYSIDELCNEIEKILNNNSIIDKNDLYRKIGEVLHWIYDCLEKINLDNMSIDERNYVTAFRGAANAQKHSKEEFNFDNFINCARFPCSFPLIFSNTGVFRWKPLDENIIDNKSQIKKYNEILANKDIVKSLNTIRKIILNYS